MSLSRVSPTPRRARRSRTWPAGVLLALLAGCGDADLWARWQAERALYAARREADRVLVHPRGASAADWERVAAAFRVVTTRWPAAWASPERAHGLGRDVAFASGRAALALARLDGMRGRDSVACVTWSRVAGDYRALPAIAVEAHVGWADALERVSRFDEALAVRESLGRTLPLVDPDGGGVFEPVVEAPFRVARELRARGRDADAESTMARASLAFERAMDGARPANGARLAVALGEARAASGDGLGALEALRRALAIAPSSTPHASLVLALATQSLDLELPDTALAYARLAQTYGGTARAAGRLLEGEAWEQRQQGDSALASYAGVLDKDVPGGSLGAIARFRRGDLFERSGQWELARTEWRTLAAEYPSHELSFRSLERIVQHHVALGQTDFARLEGTRGMETLTHLLEVNRDPDVQREARTVRANLLELTGREADAERELIELWTRFPGDSAAEAAALRAARLARGVPGGAARADSLLRLLARRATSAAIRGAAAGELPAGGAR